MGVLDRRSPVLYAGRRGIAFAIDFEIAQVIAHLILNLADLPLPTWSLSLFFPFAFAGYSLLLLERGPVARTFGKRLMGLAVRAVDGKRPSAAALRMRTLVLASLALVDWEVLLSGAMGDPRVFGRVLAISVAVGLALLSLGIVRQIQTGALTPHDAIAGTCVEPLKSWERVSFREVPVAHAGLLAFVAAVVLTFLFTIHLPTAFEDACPACRVVEREIASRCLMPSRVSMSQTGTRDSSWLQTTVWLPALSSGRGKARNRALRIADSVTVASALVSGLPPAPRTLTHEITQAPLVLRTHHHAAETAKWADIDFVIGIGGSLNALKANIAWTLKFKAVPLDGAEN